MKYRNLVVYFFPLNPPWWHVSYFFSFLSGNLSPPPPPHPTTPPWYLCSVVCRGNSVLLITCPYLCAGPDKADHCYHYHTLSVAYAVGTGLLTGVLVVCPDGPFCFCSNANNNTYWCMRTINTTSDFLYCEYITNFIAFYNMTTDPFQVTVLDVPLTPFCLALLPLA